MKFTKENAFEKLKGVLTQNGKTPRMSDRSISDFVDTLLEAEKDNEDLELDAFVAKYQKALVSFNGNIEHEVSSGISNFKTEWEKNHPAPKKDPDPDPAKNVTPEMKALMDRLNALEQKNAELEKNNALKTTKAALLAKMQEKGINDDEWSQEILEQISIEENMDVESKADSLVKLFNKTHAASPQGTTPRSTSAASEQQNSSVAAASAAAKARREAQEKLQ